MQDESTGVDLTQVVMSAAVGMAVTDLHGQLVRVNHAFAELLHTSVGNLVGRTSTEVLSSAGGSHDVDGTVEQLLTGVPTVSGDVLVRRDDGSDFRARTLSSLATTATGAAVVLLHLLDAETRGSTPAFPPPVPPTP